MKIDKDFAIKVDDKIYSADEIYSINIDNARIKIECWNKNGSRFSAEASTKDIEFVSVPHIPILAQGGVVVGRDRTHTYREYCKVGDEPASDIEIVSPPEKHKKALDEAIKGIDKTQGLIQVGVTLDGEQVVKAIKPGGTMHSREPLRKESDNLDGAGFFDLAMNRIKEDNELREAIKQAVREVMEEDAIGRVRLKKEKLAMDRKEFEEMTKKYQGR